MPVLEEKNVPKSVMNNTNKSNKKEADSSVKFKKKKHARWSLGKDSKGRRISFGFRDENTERNFLTPTRESKNETPLSSSRFDRVVDSKNNFEDVSVMR